MTKVLMIVTAADHWTLNDGTSHPTGFWAEELITPYSIFTDAGWDIDVATPGGIAPTVDNASLDESAGDAETLEAVKAKLEELQPVLAEPLNLDDVDAVSRGVDALAVQGPGAGGHRGTFDPGASPASQSLDHLLADVLAAVDVPVAAAGGLISAEDVAGVLAAGAVAAQLGTAFLLADESGSSPVHRAALQSQEFTETVVTRAFSGRYARGLRNRFITEHDGQAPLGYPEIHYLTSPVRKASVAAGDPQATNVWAGTGWRGARTGSVAEIIEGLTPDR